MSGSECGMKHIRRTRDPPLADRGVTSNLKLMAQATSWKELG